MKISTKYLRFGVLMTASVGILTSSWAYDGAGGRLLFQRNPIVNQQSIDSDVRLRGMGGLNVAVKEESNAMDNFRFGDLPSGLPAAYPRAKVELGLFHESGPFKDQSSVADTFVDDVYDFSDFSLSFMGAVPFGENERAGAVAGYFGHVDNDLDYTTQGAMASGGYSHLQNKPSFNKGLLAYGQNFGPWIIGLSAGGNYFTLADVDAILSGNNITSEVTLDITDVVFSVGRIFELSGDQRISASAGPFLRMRDTESNVVLPASSSKTESDANGVGGRLAVQYTNSTVFDGALAIERASLDGDYDRTVNSNKTTGSGDFEDTAVKLRLRVHPESIPFTFGFGFKTDVSGSDASAGNAKVDGEETDTEIALGATGHFPNEKGLAGVEFRLLDSEEKDKITPANTEEQSGHEIVVGGEYQVAHPVWLRTGVRMRNTEEKVGSGPDVGLSELEYNLGTEWKVRENLALNLIYAYHKIKSDSDTTVPVDEFAYQGNSLNFLAHLYW